MSSCAGKLLEVTLSYRPPILHINLRCDPCSLDPRKGNDMIASQLHFLLFEGLVRLNADMSLTPALAKSYEISPDGKIYTFHLHHAVWSDGTPITAHDVERSWKQILDPSFSCPDAYLLYAVRNAKLAKSGKVPLEEVAIRSTDDHTLVVELDSPMFHFLQIVASSVLLPVPPNIDALVSNGPFHLKEWRPREKLVFEKNPLYHRANEVKLHGIVAHILDGDSVLHMHEKGHLDLIGTPLSYFSPELIESLEKQKRLTYFPVAATKFLAFNTVSTPFQNTNLRKAFAYAISRASLPPVLMNRDRELLDDATQARAYLQQGLAEMGLTQLGSPVFMFIPSEINKVLAQALQQMWWEALGVQVTLEQTEFKTLHERSQKGDFAIGLFAWLADYADPMNILERFTDKTCHRNYPKWEDAKYNQLVQEARSLSLKEEYLAKVEEAEERLMQEMPLTCLFHETYAFSLAPYVKGFEISPLGHIYFEKISIEE